MTVLKDISFVKDTVDVDWFIANNIAAHLLFDSNGVLVRVHTDKDKSLTTAQKNLIKAEYPQLT